MQAWCCFISSPPATTTLDQDLGNTHCASPIIAARPIFTHVPAGCVALLIAGGAAYTSGVIFYQWHRLPYHHAVWHLFVAIGSALHFFAAWRYLLPATH